MKKRLAFLLCLICLLLASCNTQLNYMEYFNKTVEIVCSNDKSISYATGTVISNNGLIITNKHVVSNYIEESSIKVNYIDNTISYDARIIKVSEEYDLALISIDKDTDYFYNITEDFIVGEDIYGIGNPFGLGLSLYKGIITSSYKNMNFDNEKILSIQTSIEFDDGASGGPVFNSKGELIGLMTYRLVVSYGYVPGVSFLVPSQSIKQFLNREDNI